MNIDNFPIYTRLTLDPVRESVTKAVSAMLTAGGVKAPAEVIDLAQAKQKQAGSDTGWGFLGGNSGNKILKSAPLLGLRCSHYPMRMGFRVGTGGNSFAIRCDEALRGTETARTGFPADPTPARRN